MLVVVTESEHGTGKLSIKKAPVKKAAKKKAAKKT